MLWLLHIWYVFSGANNETGPVYGSWSGVFGATSVFAFIPTGYVLARKHNCHVHRCWRLGRHPVDKTPYHVCRKHHPDPKVREGLKAHHVHRHWADGEPTA